MEKLNSEKTIIFELNKSCGFFSVLFFLCKFYIYAKKNDFKFYIKYDKWSYDGGYGWHGYFDSLLEYDNSDSLLEYDNSDGNIMVFKHGSYLPKIVPTYELFEYINVIREIFIPNKEIMEKAEEYIKNTIKEPYISIYVRRGDKHTETRFISETSIINKIKRKNDINNNTKFFIQTDDYTVIENIKKILPNNEIFYLVPETKRGHYQSEQYLNDKKDKNPYKNEITIGFNDISDKNIVKNDTIELITSIIISSRASQCWFDQDSNVGRFLKLYSPENTFSYNNKDSNIFRFSSKKKIDPYAGI